jgi:adenylate cyclase
MALKDDISKNVDEILSRRWETREGRAVPEIETVALRGDTVKLNATMLYSDLAASTALATYSREIASRVYKCFLSCTSKVITNGGGSIRSFDGDRVMAVFVGDSKNTSAAKVALKINWMFLNIIEPKLRAKYQVFSNGTFSLAQCVGIDTSEMTVIRAGIRDNNDLVWVGRAPNYAAKLSSIRNSPYHSYITEEVFNAMRDEAKLSDPDKKPMWERRENKTDLPGNHVFYRSNWSWILS